MYLDQLLRIPASGHYKCINSFYKYFFVNVQQVLNPRLGSKRGFDDILGLYEDLTPKHSKRFGDFKMAIQNKLAEYKNRWGFHGRRAPDHIREEYLNKSIAHHKKRGAANPIRFSI